jgi:multidrug efflux pump subunit AcrA (membrane-fusion protein)
VIGANNVVQRRTVTVVARQDGIAVIGTGLSAGESVVTGGQYRLTDGARVTIETAEATPTG